jgi:hypothetical protein
VRAAGLGAEQIVSDVERGQLSRASRQLADAIVEDLAVRQTRQNGVQIARVSAVVARVLADRFFVTLIFPRVLLFVLVLAFPTVLALSGSFIAFVIVLRRTLRLAVFDGRRGRAFRLWLAVGFRLAVFDRRRGRAFRLWFAVFDGRRGPAFRLWFAVRFWLAVLDGRCGRTGLRDLWEANLRKLQLQHGQVLISDGC